MVFTSWAFVAFFLVVLIAIRLAPTRASRQLVILLASAFFYGYWNKLYLILLATPSIIDYYCALYIEASDNPKTRKRILLLSLCTNLGLLGYFKYTNFFLSTIGAVLGRHYRPLDILLPVGISFYTFKTLSYTIDVYRREIPACRDCRFVMFVTFFPELVAGPIVRASDFLPQIVAVPPPFLDARTAASTSSSSASSKKVAHRRSPRPSRRPRLRRPARSSRPRLPAGRLRLRHPDLLRLLRLHRHRHRHWPA